MSDCKTSPSRFDPDAQLQNTEGSKISTFIHLCKPDSVFLALTEINDLGHVLKPFADRLIRLHVRPQ